MRAAIVMDISVVTVVYFCTFYLYATAKLDNTLFERDVSFDNKLPEEIPEETPSYGVLVISFPRCARHCHDKKMCLAFIHNHLTGNCQLFSKVNLTRQSGKDVSGNMMFKKIATTIQEDHTGGLPCNEPIIPNGKLLSIVGQGEGCKAYFVCDDLYFPTVLHGVFSDNVWTGLTEPCDYMNIIPATFKPPGGLDSGQCVIIHTKIPPANETARIILKSKDHSELFLNITFHINDEIIYRRSRIAGVQSDKETYLPYWPLTVGQDVNFKFCIEETLFRMHIDGVEMFTHSRRPSTHTIDKMKFMVFNVTTLVFTDSI